MVVGSAYVLYEKATKATETNKNQRKPTETNEKSPTKSNGFHGEGEYAATIRFDTVYGAQLTEQLQNTDGWKTLPLEEELELLMYGGNRHYRTLNAMFCSAFLQFVVYCFK